MTRKSPRLNRVPTQEIIVEKEKDECLIGLTAARLHSKSVSDPITYSLSSTPESTPEKQRGRGDGEVPVNVKVEEEEEEKERVGVKEGAEIEYLIRQRGVGASIQVNNFLL